MEDEELEQPKNKITLSSFFESIASVEKVANNALSIANSNLNIIQEQKSLIDALSLSIEGLRGDIQEVNNYITIQKNEVSDKLVETRDDKQKQMISERLQGLQGEKGEKGDVGASGQGVSASEERMSASKEKKELEEFVNQVIDKREQKKENERKDELREKEDAEQKKEQSEKLQNKSQGGQQAGVGAVGDFDIGDSAPLNNQGGEKKGLMKFLKNPLAMKLAAGAGLLSAGALIPNLFPSTVNKQERKTIQSIDKIGKESTVDELQKIVDKPSIMDRITGRHAEAKEQLYFIEEGKTKGYGYDFEQNPRTYDFDKKGDGETGTKGDKGQKGEKGQDGFLGFGGKDKPPKSKYQKLVDSGYKFDDKGMVGGQRIITHTGPEHGQKFSKGIGGMLGIGNIGRYQRGQTGTRTITGEGSGDSLEDIVNRGNLEVPKKRGLLSLMGGAIDSATGNLTDFDQKGGETFGSTRILGGLIDSATGNLTDIDKKGGETFGLTRGITGVADFLTGNKYNLDKKPVNKKKKDEEKKSKNDVSVKDSDLSQEDKQRLLEIEMEMESLENEGKFGSKEWHKLDEEETAILQKYSGKGKIEPEKTGKKKGKRGIKGIIGGVADSLTGGFFDFDKRGDTKGQDFLQGTADTLTGGVFDFDEKGSNKLQRFQQGFADAMTGNLTDFDRKGGKTVGATRTVTGMADFFTADMFDLDKRGKMDLFGMRKQMQDKKKKEVFENNSRVKNQKDFLLNRLDPTRNFRINTGDGKVLKKGDEGFEQALKKSKEFYRKTQSGDFSLNSVVESKEKNLSQNTLASPDTLDSQLLVMQGANQESSSKNIISPAEAPQVKEGELKSTESTSSFVKTISNNIVMSSKKSKLAGLPPEIARMLK